MHIVGRGCERNVYNCQEKLDWDHQVLVITALEHDPASFLDSWGGLGAHDWARLEWRGARPTLDILTDELLPKGVTYLAAHRISEPTGLLVKKKNIDGELKKGYGTK